MDGSPAVRLLAGGQALKQATRGHDVMRRMHVYSHGRPPGDDVGERWPAMRPVLKLLGNLFRQQARRTGRGPGAEGTEAVRVGVRRAGGGGWRRMHVWHDDIDVCGARVWVDGGKWAGRAGVACFKHVGGTGWRGGQSMQVCARGSAEGPKPD
jgi:hypothetical protein